MMRQTFGLALCLIASTGFAKDLRHAEPSPTSKGCEWAGPDFVRLEGSDTCVRVSGSVRADVSRTQLGTTALQWK